MQRMAEASTVAAAVWIIATVACVFFLRNAAQLLIPIVLAILISYALEPVVAWFQQRRVPRTAGAAALLLSDVTACTITAFDQDNTQLGASLSGAGCDAIRRVSVSVTVQRNGISETLRTRVYIRSTMEGDA